MNTRRARVRFGVLFVFLALFMSVLAPTATFAAGAADSMTIDDRLKAYILYHSVGSCFDGINDFSVADAGDNTWDAGGNSIKNVGWYLAPDDSNWECATIVKNLLPLLGFSNIGDMLKSWQYKIQGNDWHHDNADLGPDRGAGLRAALYANGNPYVQQYDKFALAQKVFSVKCQPSGGVLYSEANASQKADAAAATTTSKHVRTSIVEGSPPKPVDMIYTVVGNGILYNLGPGFDKKNCAELGKIMADTASAFAIYSRTHQSETSIYTGQPVNNQTGDGEPTKSTCAIDSIGWIVCPVMNFMASIVDGAYVVVESLLQVQPLTLPRKQCIEAAI